jgi:hypothetical protein
MAGAIAYSTAVECADPIAVARTVANLATAVEACLKAVTGVIADVSTEAGAGVFTLA